MKLNLFKYYAPKYNGEYNLSFYEKGQIYFQKPERFNDPWDCKAPKIVIPRQVGFLRDFHFYISRMHGDVWAREAWNRIKNLPRPQIRETYRNLFDEALENIRKKIGVFSLSFVPDSELMWSHYAESHTGYMLHFEIVTEYYLTDHLMTDIGVPIPVIYKTQRHNINIASYHSNPEKNIYDLIRFKSNAWSYEYELRLINEKKFGFISYPNSWLKSITLGIASEEKLKEKLISIGNELNLSVFFAEIDKEHFKINIPGLNIDGSKGHKSYNEIVSTKIIELK